MEPCASTSTVENQQTEPELKRLKAAAPVLMNSGENLDNVAVNNSSRAVNLLETLNLDKNVLQFNNCTVTFNVYQNKMNLIDSNN